jgi:L-alanine-DL-glutamate epimerase-like enolase superfamily enzyme
VTRLRISNIDVLNLSEQAAADAIDVVFIRVRTREEYGWYGPVTETISRRIGELAPLIADSKPRSAAETWRRLKRTSRKRMDALTSWAIGAIDCAIWDLRGRIAGVPVAVLLAQRQTRPAIRVYASSLTCQLTEPAALDTVAEISQDGWAFTKWGLRAQQDDDPQVQASRMAEAITAATRAAGGPVAVDAVGTWDADLTRAFARRIDPATLIWLEDPLSGHFGASYQAVALADVPIAAGEHLTVTGNLQRLLSALRPVSLCLDIAGCGGLTRAAEITAQAWQHGIPVYPHGRSLAPGSHLAAAFGEAVPAVEYRLRWEPGRQRLVSHPLTPDQGLLMLPQAPGLGITPGAQHA